VPRADSPRGPRPHSTWRTLCRVLHRTKSKMCAKPSGCTLLPSLCCDAAQREYRDYHATPSPPGVRVRVVIGPQSLLQSLSQAERDLSFRNGVIGMTTARGSWRRGLDGAWRNSRKRRVLNVTLTPSWVSPARQPHVHAVQQWRRGALPIANTWAARHHTSPQGAAGDHGEQRVW